jgi:hypothetical protein
MASKTSYLGLGYFDYRDRLDTSMSVRVEAERFNIIDRQLYGILSIFGDGVVTGMQAVIRQSSISGTQSIEIQAGTVIIRGRAYILDNPVEITDTGVSGEFYLYAIDSDISQGERQLGFGFDKSPLSSIGVRICRVFAPFGNVSSVDNAVRQEVSFKSLIQQEIAGHRHSGSPSRIDLLREVKNALPGARVQSLDASKIASGVLSKGRIPRLDHSNLDNKGVLSHTELESMALHLASFSRVLMSEVASRNLMQQAILLRRNFPSSRDESVNMVTFVPGVTPSSMIDFDNTTANFNAASGCISGTPQPAGRIIQISYRSPQAMQSGFQVENLIFTNNAYILTSSFGTGSSVQFKDSFENATGSNQPIPGFSSGTESVSNNIRVVSDTTTLTDGAFSANIRSGKKDKSVYKRAVASSRNWNAYNRLFVDVKCISDNHPTVYMYFNSISSGQSVSSEKFVLLGENEITSGSNAGFKTAEFNIESYDRTDVREIVFEVEDSSVDFSFNVDNVRTSSVQSDNIVYANSGFVRYRYNSNSLVFLNTIFFDISDSNGTRHEVRYRAGRTFNEMQNSEFSSPVASGDFIGSVCSFLEIEVRLFTNPSKTDTSSFIGMDISLNVPGGSPRFEFDTAAEWEAGEETAVDIVDADGGYISIRSPLETGDLIYSHQDRIQQLRLLAGSYVPRRAWLGNNTFVSPAAAMDSAESTPVPSFDQPSRVHRLPNRNILISDTYNNRIMELDENDNFIKGFGGAFFTSREQGNVPLAAVYNPRSRVLQIVFAFDVPSTVNTDFIVLRIGTSIIRLSARDTIIDSGYPGNVLAIELAQDRASLIESIPTGTLVRARLEDALFGSEFTFNRESPVYGFVHGAEGINVFVGDFTFVPHIVHPICAITDSSGNICVANSTIFFDRIRAGLRDDTDEFFISPGKNTTFYVVATLDDATELLNPKVVFVNDPNAVTEDNLTFEQLVFQDSSGAVLDGTITVSQVSNLVAEVKINPNASSVGKTFLGRIKIRILVGEAGSRQEIPASPFFVEKRVTVVELPSESGDPNVASIPSFVYMNGVSGSVIRSYGNNNTFTFTDFTLGGIHIDEELNRVAVAGVFKLDANIAPPPANVDPTTFRGQAALLLQNRRGRMVEMTLDQFEVVRKYDSPDGLYCSDISKEQDGQYAIAESAILNASGRAIRLDPFNNITFFLGGGQFGVINRLTPTNDGTLIFST